MGIGQTAVVAPVYLSEIAPKSHRGLCCCIFAGSVYVGIMLAYFANFGVLRHIAGDAQNSWVRKTRLLQVTHILTASDDSDLVALYVCRADHVSINFQL